MQYTDYFGQPLAVGDEIVYPVASGASRASFARWKIVALVPLIPHRRNAKQLMREDQIGQQHPTIYTWRDDPAKRFVVQVMRKSRWDERNNLPGRKFSIQHSENVIRVPDGC